MWEEALLCHEPSPDVRLEQLQTLARLERRAESLRAELAALQEMLTCFAHADQSDAANLRGAETILIVDDLCSVRAITQGMLESFGYRVLVTCPSGYARLELCAADLVLLDVPVWGGRVRSRLRQIRACSVPIVVSTPLPEGRARLEMRQAGAAAFISKPFHPLELARCIRQVLDVTAPASPKQS